MGAGGIVNDIRKAARDTLSNPLVHGQLQTPTQVLVDAVFDKDDMDWTDKDCDIIGKTLHWVLKNIR